ncbi:MAG: hypothetical protein OFPI_12210 [Osedax symbiont Rs2]|nr:MAG: hypothetical protein OFPI_12210 [Osedax symbiont Rs2]
MSKTKPIWMVIGALILTVVIFVLINKEQFVVSDVSAVQIELGDKSNNQFKIVVYYFPEKKSEALALTNYFQEHSYDITMQPAASAPALKGSKNSPSHIFFNRSDIGKAMSLKLDIEAVIGKSVNAYRFHEEQTDPSMMMVFTEH